MKPQKIIYVCAPLKSSKYAHTSENIANAQNIMIELLRRNFTPLCPHTMYLGLEGLKDYNSEEIDFYAITLELLKACDGVLALENCWEISSGCREEVLFARTNEIPVYYSYKELENAYTGNIHSDTE